MKKLMMAAVIALAAIATQAATTKWSTTAVMFDGTKLGNQSVSLYIVGVGGASDLLYDTRTTANAPSAKKGTLASDVGSQSYDYTDTVAGGALANVSYDAGTSSWSDAGREYYIVLTYNDGEYDYTYTSSTVASSGLSDTKLGSVAFTFSDTITSVAGTKDAWVYEEPEPEPTPEPTSGLLMLIGMAGLALRRKQK